MLLSWLEDRKSVRPSSALVVYLMLTSLLDAAQCRTLWLQFGRQDALTSICLATTILKLAMALLESRNKRSYLSPVYADLPPESTGGIVNHSFLWWVNSLFKLGFGSAIRPQDLFPLGREMSSAHLSVRMRDVWAARRRPERRFEVPLAALKVLWFPMLQVVLPRICLIGLTFSQPFLIYRVLDLLQEPETDARNAKGYGLIGAAALIYFGLAVVNLHYYVKVTRFITMFRGMTIGLIYEHLLQLPLGACSEGAATTLMSADVERIAETLTQLNECWARAVEVALGIGLLTWQLGWVSVMPLAVVIGKFSLKSAAY